MSFQHEEPLYQNWVRGRYVGIDDQTPVTAGNFQVRLNTANAIEILSTSAETVEIYRFSRRESAIVTAANFNTQALAANTWVNIHPLVQTAANEVTDIWVTRTADAVGAPNQLWYHFQVWHASATKVCLWAAETGAAASMPSVASLLNNLSMTATGNLVSTIGGVPASLPFVAPTPTIHHHRVALPDFPRVSTFNGQTYSAAAGWIPAISSMRFETTGSTYTNHGLNWALNAAGNWEVYGDVDGNGETWTLNLTFKQHRTAAITRFGTFN